jgi:hypothetical protein
LSFEREDVVRPTIAEASRCDPKVSIVIMASRRASVCSRTGRAVISCCYRWPPAGAMAVLMCLADVCSGANQLTRSGGPPEQAQRISTVGAVAATHHWRLVCAGANNTLLGRRRPVAVLTVCETPSVMSICHAFSAVGSSWLMSPCRLVCAGANDKAYGRKRSEPAH